MNGWRDIISTARRPAKAFAAALDDPEAAQRDLLSSIVAANAHSQFGARHDFPRIRTWEDFKEAVPIRTYAEMAQLIGRSAAGEPGVLTTEPVIAFEETGGSATGAKLIPLTAGSLGAFRRAVLPWLHDLARRRPAITQGLSYVAISPAMRQRRSTAAGVPVGVASDAVYLGDDLASAFVSLLAVPPQVSLAEGIEEWRVATLAHLVSAEDLAFVSVWSPTFFLDLIDALLVNAGEVSARIGRTHRQRLECALRSGRLDTARLWPRLDTISCWADGTSAPYARRLGELCPHAAIEAKGLFATEAAMTLPWGASRGCVPALASTFLEFVGGCGATRLAHQLISGECYRIVITTPGGLYRYDIGDVVRCTGYVSRSPVLVFEGRASLSSDLVGEKLDDVFATSVLAALRIPAVLHPRAGPKPHYELWVGGNGDAGEIGRRIEEGLCGNPQYAYARRIGQLGPLVVVFKPDFQAEQGLASAMQGRRLGVIKPSAILK